MSDPNGSPVTDSDRYAHRFGSSPPLSLGVEEELLLVDPETHRLVPSAELVLDSVSGAAGERVSSEIFSEQIEIKTGVCLGADDALAELREGRATIAATGVGLLGSGLHPAEEGDARLVAKPRYEVVREDLGDILNTPPCGLHVHVGMPEAETAVRIANAFRLYLPVLAALSANSPFRGGADSGHASARTTVVRAYPRFQVPRRFRDYEDFCRVADQLIAAAGVDDYTYIWWDVRPHPKLGTVEARAVDVQADAATSAALAALIQAIAAEELDRPSEPALEREALEESYFQASSHGLDARIVLSEPEPRPAREVARAVLDAALPYAREWRRRRARGGRADPARGQRRRRAAPCPRRGRHGRSARPPGGPHALIRGASRPVCRAAVARPDPGPGGRRFAGALGAGRRVRLLAEGLAVGIDRVARVVALSKGSGYSVSSGSPTGLFKAWCGSLSREMFPGSTAGFGGASVPVVIGGSGCGTESSVSPPPASRRPRFSPWPAAPVSAPPSSAPGGAVGVSAIGSDVAPGSSPPPLRTLRRTIPPSARALRPAPAAINFTRFVVPETRLLPGRSGRLGMADYCPDRAPA